MRKSFVENHEPTHSMSDPVIESGREYGANKH